MHSGSDFVDGIVESKPGVQISAVAFQVLEQWKREKAEQASSTELYCILKYDLKWEQIAAELASR